MSDSSKLDFDLNLDELAAELEEKLLKKAPAEPSPKNEYEECVERLKKHSENMWICLPSVDENNRLLLDTRKVNDDLDDEFFFKWLCYTYPVAKTLNHDAAMYDKTDHKRNAITNVIAKMKSWELKIQEGPKDEATATDKVKVTKE